MFLCGILCPKHSTWNRSKHLSSQVQTLWMKNPGSTQKGGLAQSHEATLKMDLAGYVQDDSVTWLSGGLPLWASPEYSAASWHGSWPPPKQVIQKRAMHEPRCLMMWLQSPPPSLLEHFSNYTGWPYFGNRPHKNLYTRTWTSLESEWSWWPHM